MYLNGQEYIDSHVKHIKEEFKKFKVLSEGKLSQDFCNNLLMNLAIFKYFERQDIFYEEQSSHVEGLYDPEEITWIDVEGFDYGWDWLQFKDEPKDDFTKIREYLFNDIKKVLDESLEFDNNYIMFCYIDDETDEITYCYYIYNTDFDSIGIASDLLISVSNTPLDMV